MPDPIDLTQLTGPTLAALAGHQLDLSVLALAPTQEYVVGAVSMGTYDFVPYAVTGLAGALAAPTGEATRASMTVTVPVRDETDRPDLPVSRTVTVYGPGDVATLDPNQIVRRYPTPGATAAEETFQAHIEFDRPELPWAFSAAAPADDMRPWLTLLVLTADEVSWEPAAGAPNPVISVPAACLPDLSRAHHWAHAEALRSPAALTTRLSLAHAPTNVSRLIAGRVLRDSTDYVAVLVPTTDAGVRAGLGLPGGTLAHAWTTGGQQPVRLPVYDSWQFRTAPDGDFPRLTARLHALAAPWSLGRRVLDTSRPGLPLSDLPDGAPGRRQVISCAVYSPNPAPAGAPAEGAAWEADRQDELRSAVERAWQLETERGRDANGVPLLPLIGPRAYAAGQRGSTSLARSDWFGELNSSPAHRVVAGLGTRVVQQDQERLMQAAWAQLGEVDKANRELALAQVAKVTATALHSRLTRMDPGELLHLVAPAAPRIGTDRSVSLTLQGQTQASATPPSALAGAFRRVVRPTGPALRHLSAEAAGSVQLLTRGDTIRDFQRLYREPDGVTGLSTAAINALDAAAVARVVGVEPAQVTSSLAQWSTTLTRTGGLANQLLRPALDDSAEIDRGAHLRDQVLRQWSESIVRFAGDAVETDPRVATWAGALALGLAGTNDAATTPAWTVAAQAHAVLHRHWLDRAPLTPAPEPDRAGPGRTGPGRVTPGRVGPQVGLTRDVTERLSAAALARQRSNERVTLGRLDLTRQTTAETFWKGVEGRRVIVGPELHPIAEAEKRRDLDTVDLLLRNATQRAATGSGVFLPQDRPITATQEALTAAPQVQAMLAVAESLVSLDPRQARTLVAGFDTTIGTAALPAVTPRPVLALTTRDLLARLDPATTVAQATWGRITVNRDVASYAGVGDLLLRPIMAAPRFTRSMYLSLHEYDREWLIPGLGALEVDEFVTLLAMNEVFTEAFLLGLSDEMGRELLWRQYPTDQRGTYFHRFWSADTDELRRPIHRFGGGALGSHLTFAAQGDSARAVILIRGEVVRRYPDMAVYAVREQGRDGDVPILPDTPDPDPSRAGGPTAAAIIFEAMLPPDVLLVGLDITIDELRSDGWWILLSEHPTAARFERQRPDTSDIAFVYGTAQDTGATFARDRLAQPVRVAFEAASFLTPEVD